ncbi:alpha-2-macroglobulin family protein [Hymenobacter sp. YC55]|uniref:alpha-2-macroglobulin family protein n=1 Tax=Hymenobacter sp. YC55 TaxID=3034019 RepID=UPI0023F6683C|nr:alpha-2-macroglobulin family protein [Hymenobacter sp. YC55]MDF7813321.1 alpha-2-macroglobulin family protein [Hymenobacter sp. YC55]
MRFFLVSLFALLMLFTAGSSAPTPPGSGGNAAAWKRIDQLLSKDQSTSAAKLLEPLYQQARQRQDAPEYLRALLYKLRLLDAKEEEADEKAIALVEADLKTAKFPAKPILHSLLAQLYTTYYNRHRYQLHNRTTQAVTNPTDASAADVRTWDAAHFGSAIVQHYQASVADELRRQQQLQLKTLGYAIRGGNTEGRALRPTLYDLLAHRVVDNLQNDEFYVTRPADQFELKSPVLFGSAADFARLPLQAPKADSLNGQFYALRVLQQLTTFRLTDSKNLAALADVDLKRLRFVQQYTTLANKDSLYQAALARTAEVYKALPTSTEVLLELANHFSETEPAKAREITLQAEKRFPDSYGAQQARVLRQRLEAAELRFTTEEVVLPQQPWLMRLNVRNAAQLYAKAYRVTIAQEIRRLSQGNYYQESDLLTAYARALTAKPAATWVLTMPGPADYKNHTVQHSGPALPVGHYLVVLSSTDENPTKKQEGVTTAYARLSVSELSELRRSSVKQNGAEMLVLHRQSGQPLAGVQALPLLQYYDQKAKSYKQRRGDAQTSTAEGQVQIPVAQLVENNTVLRAVLFSRGADSLLVQDGGYYGPRQPRSAELPQRHTFLYTDRAIYRPGQTLYFKGILTETLTGKSRLLTKQPVTVRLVDVNNQTVQTLSFTTSDYGSFHGSVVLPTSLLNGEMSLHVDYGEAHFAVEDYKRPTFQVTFEPVAGTPVLGKEVVVRGKATAYAGQPVDGARVQYRVTRRAFWPMFGRAYNRYIPNQGGEVEIINGTAQTDSAGGFEVKFTAKGEAQGQAKRSPWSPGYVFEVTADVTDAAGETRTGQQLINLGSQVLTLRLDVPEQLNREQLPPLQLFSTNATGEARPARGQLRLYRLAPPARSLRPRMWDRPEREALSREEFKRQFPLDAYANEDNDSTWVRTLVLTQEFNTEKSPLLADLSAPVEQQAPGRYLLEATAPAEAGVPAAKTEQRFTLYTATASTLPVPTPNWFVSLQDSVAPGKVARFLVGSSEDGARLLLEVEAKGETLRHEWLTLQAGEQRTVEILAPATLEGAQLYVHLTQVRDNRLYTHLANVQVATPPAPLVLSIATFRDKLQPGQKETWRVTIHQTSGKSAKAELLASLYDKSLDAFRPHDFAELAFPSSYYPPALAWNNRFGTRESNSLRSETSSFLYRRRSLAYPHLNMWGYKGQDVGSDVSAGLYGTEVGQSVVQEVVENKVYSNPPAGSPRVVIRGSVARAAPDPVAAAIARDVAANPEHLNEMVTVGYGTPKSAPQPNLSGVQARKDFRETAFWLPDLRTNAQGETILEFQMPEAVTRWQLLALAHDQQLHSGLLRRELVTQKQLQVTPNAPRFFREGDQLMLTAKLSNLTDQPLRGTAQLFLLDARTQQPLDSKVLKSPAQLKFELKANQSSAIGWSLAIPETAEGQVPLEAITYRVVASGQLPGEEKKSKKQRRQNKPTTGNAPLPTVQDGEENTLPVLPNRLLVTESLPLPIVGPATREFELKKLTSTTSPTRRNYSLTLEMTQNPAWYAVQALPYLMEYPYECSEQVFSRLYANLLAAKILASNPRFKTVLAEWNRAAQAGDKVALTSKLEQNQELKNLLLQETPWVRDAQSDTERMRRLTELFDETRLQAETTRALTKLAKMQQPNGAFPWFERMPDDRYITQLIVAGFGKLQKLGALNIQQNPQARRVVNQALAYLDGRLQRDYDELRRQNDVDLKQNHVSDLQIQALYARSFWTTQSVERATQPALTYYQQQAATFWKSETRYLQAQIALALHRQKVQPTAVKDIFVALTENALHSEELGMYWKEVRGGYYWREAPTETQATLIEAFDEVRNDQKGVDEMKLWLLKQKQTQNWTSTRATADACYALLLRGSDWLQPTQPIQVTIGGKAVVPGSQQAGTGYFKTTFPVAEIKPTQGKVVVKKTDAGVAWGAMYWQYFEQLDKITPAATPLQLERQLYREQRTTGGPILERLTATSPLRVGDVLVVRLVLRSERDLEYVHLKDQRAAGLELIGQTSSYRYQSGLGYYESPRDAATNFFISYFPKGTHTFEYRLRATQSGDFSGGLSQIQCLYAPEFTAHSAGSRVQIAPQP